MTLEEKLKIWRQQGAPGLIRYKGQSNTTAIVADEGKYRGQTVGSRTEHWSDQVDTKVTKYETHITPLGMKAVENAVNDL